MSADNVLRRRYHALLRAYPNWYRRERELEMVTTLLDGAGPGQRRPTRQEVRDVLGAAVRCRLRMPRGLGYLVVAVTVALFAALMGSAAAEQLATRLLTPTLTEPQTAAVASFAMGEAPDNVLGPNAPCAVMCQVSLEYAREPRPDASAVLPLRHTLFDCSGIRCSEDHHTSAAYWTPKDKVPAMVAQLRSRLAATGWSVESDGGGVLADYLFVANQGATSLTVVASTRDNGFSNQPDNSDRGPSIYLILHRNPPRPQLLIAWAVGLLASMLGGWMMTCWIMQRYRRHRRGVRIAILLCALPTMLVITLADLSLLGMVSGLITALPFGALGYLAFIFAVESPLTPNPLTLLIILTVVVVTAVAALPTRAHTHQDTHARVTSIT